MQNLQDLYVNELRDLYDAEQQIIDALPKMIKKATHKELKSALEAHLEETREQKHRLENLFDRLDKRPSKKQCKAMRGLIDEGEEMMKEVKEEHVRDAAIIAAAQRVEHYEIAAYGTVATFAEMLGRSEDHELLGQTLTEEKQTDEKLTRIAKEVVNPEAEAA